MDAEALLRDALRRHLVAGEFGRHRPVAQDEDAVADVAKLAFVRGAEHYRAAAAVRRGAHEPVQFGLGADVHTLRGFIEQQYGRIGAQPLAHHHFLLVAAG